MAVGCATLDPQVLPGPMAGPLADADIPAPSSPAWALIGGAPAGVSGGWVEPEILHEQVAGVAAPEHDGQWFDRIHVLPRALYVGYLAGDREVEVEIWNAYRHGRSLVAIEVTGPAGVSAPALSSPQEFAALQSRLHTIVVALIGESQVENLVIWDFAGLDDTGSELTLTGWRILVYAQHPNGQVLESYGYLTRVLEAWDGTEQRSGLRSRPDREERIKSTVCTMDRLLALQARLYAGGHFPFGVPLWMDATPATADVALAATLVALNTPGRAFVAGSLCLLYRDPEHWEALPIDSVEADHLHLQSPTAQAWEVPGTLCVPVAPGRLLSAPELQHPGGSLARLEAAFSLEAETSISAASTGAVGGTQYQGLDVLTEAQHNARAAVAEAFGRLGTLIKNPTGKRAYDDHAQQSFPTRNFLWTARHRVACVQLREFLDARQGRRVPFWTPTFCWDLQLAADSDGAGLTLEIRKAGYGQFLWPSLARRRLALFVPGQPMLLRQVTGLDDGATSETLHLDSAPGVPLAAASTRLCFLVLCRLAEDLTELTWWNPDYCEAAIRFRELPNEAPA